VIMKRPLLTMLGATALLTACGGGEDMRPVKPTASVTEFRIKSQSTTPPPSACTALYASGSSGVEVDGSMRYGSIGTLILTFVDDTSKGRAINWIDSRLGVQQGNGLGVFDQLPMIAVKTLITPETVELLRSQLPGLASIYQDAPLQYKLAESVKFIGADTAQSSYAVSGKGIGVGVIDSGVDATHPDLVHTAKNVKLVGPITPTRAAATARTWPARSAAVAMRRWAMHAFAVASRLAPRSLASVQATA
jgi:serine protease AprX